MGSSKVKSARTVFVYFGFPGSLPFLGMFWWFCSPCQSRWALFWNQLLH